MAANLKTPRTFGSEQELSKLSLHEFGECFENLRSESDFVCGKPWTKLLKFPIYGRVCLTDHGTPGLPAKLSPAPGRKTAFVFGPDTVCGALLKMNPYELLLHLGFLPEYIHLKACIQKSKYWIVLLSESLNTEQTPIVSATWQGMEEFIRKSYPEALNTVQSHWNCIKTHSVEYFEKQGNLKFITAVSDASGPLYMSYGKFIALPNPQAWQTRLFLYCELRMFELFTGDGLTCMEDGTKGDPEYVCMNYELEKIDRKEWLAIPLDVDVPQDVKVKYGSVSYT